ncbi:MAG: tripartite tricarboxylate transporter substrate binding protein [Lentisphaerae bacterium]|nr:tripartite tricarboxylate transporter substrate binding protein [Lentisphaerota bacterium]
MKKLLSMVVVVVMMMSVVAESSGGEPVKPKDYPKKNIVFLVPAPAGAALDIPTRIVVDLLDIGVNKVVVNRPGAAQTTGMMEYLTEPSDGYTILACAPAGMQIQPHIIDLPYDVNSFRHLTAMMVPESQMIVTNSKSDIKTFEDLTAKLKSGEMVTWSTANPNGIGFLAAHYFFAQSEYKMPQFVPFTGTSEGFAALLGGHIDFYVIDVSLANTKISDGQFTGVLVLDKERAKILPDVPASAELGYTGLEKFKAILWLAVHKDTPDDIAKYLKSEFDKIIQTEAYTKKLTTMGFFPPQVFTEEELTDIIVGGSNVYGEVIKRIGLGK